MNVTKLEESRHELIGHLVEVGYSPITTHRYKAMVGYILAHNDDEGTVWSSYEDVYRSLEAKGLAPTTLANYRSVLGGIQGFHLRGEYPDESPHNNLVAYNPREGLPAEFEELIAHYERTEFERGLRESTIRRTVGVSVRFFCQLQNKGVTALADIGWDEVAGFFVVDGVPARGSSSAESLRALFRAGLTLSEGPCRDVLELIPKIRRPTKNVQYLRDEEAGLVRSLIADPSSPLSLRDRAIGLLLLHYGLRCSDIAGMEKGSVCWRDCEIRIVQRKTENPLTLPLLAVVGNAIYDYLATGRPACGSEIRFLTEDTPARPINSSIVNGVANKILRLCGIRQRKGERGGAHIFRHRLATELLSKGVPQPVISGTLGHADPASTEAYFSADFAHLKECALSVEGYPVAKGVLEP